MARSARKLRQYVYLTSAVETRQGIDRVKVYTKPKRYCLVVSATAGVPTELSTGIYPEYDRTITVFKGQYTDFAPNEGDYLYVDIAPNLTDDGELELNADTNEPTTKPDYVVVRKLASSNSQVWRYGIKRI